MYVCMYGWMDELFGWNFGIWELGIRIGIGIWDFEPIVYIYLLSIYYSYHININININHRQVSLCERLFIRPLLPSSHLFISNYAKALSIIDVSMYRYNPPPPPSL